MFMCVCVCVNDCLGKVQKVIQQLSKGHAQGADAIPAEIYEEGGAVLTDKLLTLIQLIWEKEQLPQDFKDTSIIHLYKRKGNRQACDNHRGISLLSITGKILNTVTMNRLNHHPEQDLPESQCGYAKKEGRLA